ncbi:MAG TPA: YbaB/EbfC family nucleoid-associated protein [Desulfofustis sp.]|jgi:DNA-binding YbaB/EbfC family protein|nr:YbaB/EbfC family nucleoid-associated protein [Desulfofustis sp. PB-SRB1]HBH29556.1 YbaB/EbfC family nucleoid-associated protein [Desulfofustis sp.]
MDLSALMQQAREMQEKMATVQQELAATTVVGQAGGGMVSVVATGKGEIVSVAIDDVVLSEPDKSMLQDLIAAATNDALRKAGELGKEKMGALTGGIQIPGLTNLS